jgi:nitrate reductase NapE component
MTWKMTISMQLFGTVLLLIWLIWTAITVTQGALEVEKTRNMKQKLALVVVTVLSPVIIAVPFVILYKFVEWMI